MITLNNRPKLNKRKIRVGRGKVREKAKPLVEELKVKNRDLV